MVAELDPYSVLGVPRTASREEIARAYRRLAKQHHPDAGASVTTAMARINEAWHILSDPMRRARWERLNTITAPPHWVATPADVARRPRPEAQAPPSPMDSGWVAIGILAGVALVVAVLMIGVSLAAQPSDDDGPRFANEQLSFEYPPDWHITAGDGRDPIDHRVIAHLVTFGVEQRQMCTSFADPCELASDGIPPGEASIIISAWQGGTPPVPDPVFSRPFGLDADRIIGGNPAAFEIREATRDSAVAWWQLSPPGFPDRWIEVSAQISGQEIERADMIGEIDLMLRTLEFTD